MPLGEANSRVVGADQKSQLRTGRYISMAKLPSHLIVVTQTDDFPVWSLVGRKQRSSPDNAVSEKYVLGRPITSGRIVGYSSNWLPQGVANLCAVSDLLAIRNLRISPSRISTDKRASVYEYRVNSRVVSRSE